MYEYWIKMNYILLRLGFMDRSPAYDSKQLLQAPRKGRSAACVRGLGTEDDVTDHKQPWRDNLGDTDRHHPQPGGDPPGRYPGHRRPHGQWPHSTSVVLIIIVFILFIILLCTWSVTSLCSSYNCLPHNNSLFSSVYLSCIFI